MLCTKWDMDISRNLMFCGFVCFFHLIFLSPYVKKSKLPLFVHSYIRILNMFSKQTTKNPRIDSLDEFFFGCCRDLGFKCPVWFLMLACPSRSMIALIGMPARLVMDMGVAGGVCFLVFWPSWCFFFFFLNLLFKFIYNDFKFFFYQIMRWNGSSQL